jgi:hypothetical protein
MLEGVITAQPGDWIVRDVKGELYPCKPDIFAATLQPHQQRVVDEKVELDDKRVKLTAFFSTPTFAALPADEKERLEAQEHFMAGYSNVLAHRIAHF